MSELLPLIFYREAAARAALDFVLNSRQPQTDLALIQATLTGGVLYDATTNTAVYNKVRAYTEIDGVYELLLSGAYVSCHDVTHHFASTDNNFYEARLGDLVLFRDDGSPLNKIAIHADRVGVVTSLPKGPNFYLNITSIGFPNYGITRQPNNAGLLQEKYPAVRCYVMSFRV